ncbi:MAG: hypothetical protein NTW05_11245 [Pseudonocardiales bacterium]|nr:hypothetical protein [Pseudonocardiales bacterium]
MLAVVVAVVASTGSQVDTSASSSGDGFVLFEDFSGSTLDAGRWLGAGEAAPTVTVVDGTLRVESAAQAGEGSAVGIEAVFAPGVDAVRFVITVDFDDVYVRYA